MRGLLTNVERTRRHMPTSSLCQLCQREDEDAKLIPPGSFDDFMFASLHDWLLVNIGNNSFSATGDIEWSRCFSGCGKWRHIDTVITQVWLAPDLGWVKANADGVVDIRSGVAASGGVIRDEYVVVETNNMEASQILTSCSKEANEIADALIRICRGKPIGVVIFSSLSAEVVMSMLKDTQYIN
ncbi:hypothetical protein GQ457_01G027300 [Hibiscus cannabinus]